VLAAGAERPSPTCRTSSIKSAEGTGCLTDGFSGDHPALNLGFPGLMSNVLICNGFQSLRARMGFTP
jgi:hypothetical protein